MVIRWTSESSSMNENLPPSCGVDEHEIMDRLVV